MVKFTKEEDNFVADFYLLHQETLESTSQELDANKRRNALYEKLVAQLNQLNPDDVKTTKQVKEKIQYLKSRSKQNYSKKKKSMQKTGSSKDKTPKLNPTDEKIISVLGKTSKKVTPTRPPRHDVREFVTVIARHLDINW